MSEKREYVTQRAHGDYPAGTQCLAWREADGMLNLEFKDGVRLEVGKGFYLIGIESCGNCYEDMAREQDERFFAELAKMAVEASLAVFGTDPDPKV